MTVHTIALPNPAERMNFDGERFVTGVPGEIAHEHYLRYLFALQFCAGKDVLDVASGEGYGSSMLGQVAKTVHGTDLLEEAVAYAGRQYGSETVSFTRGDVRNLPYRDASFDVVVSFETLEHIDEHDCFFTEIKRVLRLDGLLVMSSPNRDVYLVGQPPNRFHRREPDRAEFTATVARYFRHSRIAQQRPLTGAVLFADTPIADDRIETFALHGTAVERRDGLGEATYLIGLASEVELPAVAWGVLVDVGYLNDRLSRLHEEQVVFRSEIGRLTDIVEARKADIDRLSTDLGFLQDENAKLKALLAELGEQCREDLVKQRVRLLADVLEIFS